MQEYRCVECVTYAKTSEDVDANINPTNSSDANILQLSNCYLNGISFRVGHCRLKTSIASGARFAENGVAVATQAFSERKHLLFAAYAYSEMCKSFHLTARGRLHAVGHTHDFDAGLVLVEREEVTAKLLVWVGVHVVRMHAEILSVELAELFDVVSPNGYVLDFHCRKCYVICCCSAIPTVWYPADA